MIISSPKLTHNQREDYRKFFIEKGDPGFSPERNKATIERVLKSNEEMHKKLKVKYSDELRYRADAIATFLKSNKAQGNDVSDKLIMDYFGRELQKLQGRRIQEKVKYIKDNLGNPQRVVEIQQIK